MKKKYTKPQIYVESFELSQHIAGVCGSSGRANHVGITDCGFDNGDPGGYYFLDDNKTKCGYNPFGDLPENEIMELITQCYYVEFNDDGRMFSS